MTQSIFNSQLTRVLNIKNEKEKNRRGFITDVTDVILQENQQMESQLSIVEKEYLSDFYQELIKRLNKENIEDVTDEILHEVVVENEEESQQKENEEDGDYEIEQEVSDYQDANVEESNAEREEHGIIQTVKLAVSINLDEYLIKDGKKLKCSTCQKGNNEEEKKKTFSSRGNLRRHVERNHFEVKSFQCKCGGKFFGKQNILGHLSRHRERNLKCPHKECQKFKKKFNSLTLVNHEKRIHGNNPIKCCQCGKIFSSKGTRTTHMKKFCPKK